MSDDGLNAENTTDPDNTYRNHIPLGTISGQTGTYNGTSFSPTKPRGEFVLELTSGAGSVYVDSSPDDGSSWVPQNGGTAIGTYSGVGNYEFSVGPMTSNQNVVLGDMCRVRLIITTATSGTLSFLEDSFF